jgi:hypothetical protein
LKAAIDVPGGGFCDACLTGRYPVAVPVAVRGGTWTMASGDRLSGDGPSLDGVAGGPDGEVRKATALQAAFPGV